MLERIWLRKDIRRTLLRGVGWFASIAVMAALLTACGGGGGDDQPPLTPAASLTGSVRFTELVPLAAPPSDAFDGPPPPNVRYGARVIDPGDDIGGVPVPKPSTMLETGEFEFETLESNPVAYFNLRFTVDDDLEGDGSNRTPVGFNVPISLAEDFATLLDCLIDRPETSVLQMFYIYWGPDGARVVRLRLDFVTDLLSFDLDGDGLYDDLVMVDSNHDAIPDEQAPLMENLESMSPFNYEGALTGVGSHTIKVGGLTFEILGSTNVMNAANGTALSLAECNPGGLANIRAVEWGPKEIALSIWLVPTQPKEPIEIQREGVIEKIDATSLLVAGVLFNDYADAEIVDLQGHQVPPEALALGQYVSITGIHEDDVVLATHITLHTTPPPVHIERVGPIQSLQPPGAPTSMKLAGLTFQLTAETVITDLAEHSLDATYLEVGSPVWVYAQLEGTDLIAEIVQLQYVIWTPDGGEPEVVVLIDDPAAVSAVEDAVDQIDTTVPVSPVVVASWPPSPTDPPCLEEVWNEYFLKAYPVLKGMPGFVEAYPRVEDGHCEVLALIEDSHPEDISWIGFFFPDGIADAPIQCDLISLPPYYGAVDELLEAVDVKDELLTLLSDNPALVGIYVSPDIGF